MKVLHFHPRYMYTVTFCKQNFIIRCYKEEIYGISSRVDRIMSKLARTSKCISVDDQGSSRISSVLILCAWHRCRCKADHNIEISRENVRYV